MNERYVGDQEIRGCRCKDGRHEMTRKLGVGTITCNDRRYVTWEILRRLQTDWEQYRTRKGGRG